MDLLTVALASLLAGFIDEIVGGGGLVLTPALFATFPNALPATLLGTNKSASIWGTSVATWQFSRRVRMRWPVLLPAAATGFVFSFAGAALLTVVPPDLLRSLLPAVLVVLLVYTLAKKDLGRHHTPRLTGRAEVAAACAIGAAVGFYDGLLGPGAGAFYMLGFVLLAGHGILKATAHTKLLNLASNLGGLAGFALSGQPLWLLGLAMAAGQVAGAALGARLAMRAGARLIRPLLVVTSAALAARLLWQQLG